MGAGQTIRVGTTRAHRIGGSPLIRHIYHPTQSLHRAYRTALAELVGRGIIGSYRGPTDHIPRIGASRELRADLHSIMFRYFDLTIRCDSTQPI